MKIRKKLAGALALMLVLQLPMAALAEGAVVFDDGKEHIVEEDVIGKDGETDVFATGEGTIVYLEGDVLEGSIGIIARDGASVTVQNGDVTGSGSADEMTYVAGIEVNQHASIADPSNTKVVVNGDVQSDGTGIVVQNGGMADIAGSVTAGGSIGIMASDNAQIIVKEDVIAENAPTAVDVENSSVFVGGDVVGNQDGVLVMGEHSNVQVNGSVTVSNENFADGVVVYADQSHIVVGDGIESTGEGVLITGDVNEIEITGDIETAGNGATIEGDHNKVEITGNIEMETDFGSGMLISGSNNNVTITGDIVGEITSTDGHSWGTGLDLPDSYSEGPDDSDALETGYNSVTIDGNIEMKGDDNAYVNGVNVNSDHNQILIYGDVTVEAENGTGMNIIGDYNFVNTGSISSDGEVGMFVVGAGNTVFTHEVSGAIVGIAADGYGYIVSSTITGGALGVDLRDGAFVASKTISGSENGAYVEDSMLNVGTIEYGKDYDDSAAAQEGIIALGVAMDNSSMVMVSTDIVNASESGAGAGVLINVTEETADDSALLRVLGAIEGGDCGAIIISNEAGLTTEEVLEVLPEMLIHEIKAEDENFIKYVDENDQMKDASEEFYKQIKYLVYTEEIENGKITIQGITDEEIFDYGYENDRITINIVADSGYEVKEVSGGRAYVKKEADGSYTLNIPRGGGVDISAVISAIINQPTVQPETQSYGSSNSSNSSNASTATTTGAVVEVEGETQRMTFYNKIDDKVDAVAMIDTLNGKTLNRNVSAFNENAKFNGIPEDVTQIIRAMDTGDLSAAPIQFLEAVKPFGRTVRIKAKGETQVTLYATRTLKNPSVIFYDIKTGEWSVLDVTVDPATGLLVLTVPGSGIVQVVEG